MNPYLDNYQVLSEVGSGGLSKVYKCTGPNGNLYALKKIPMKYWGNPVLFECMILSSFNCPYLMKAEEIILDENVNIIMELAKSDLAQYRKKNSEISVTSIMEWIYYILLALQCLHKAGVVHGDVKAKNILVMNDNKIKLNDFNLSRYVAISTNKSAYTATHKPPEIWKGNNWDTSADLWALGCTIFEVVTGTTLFPSSPREDKPKAEYNSKMEAGIYKFCIEMGKEEYDIEKYKEGKYTPFPSFLYETAYFPILGMLSKCLVSEPLNRPTIEDLLSVYYNGSTNLYGPLNTPIFPISENILNYISELASSYEIKVATRSILRKLPPTEHTPESIKIIGSLICKLFLLSEVVITRKSIIEKENDICRKLVFNLYFKL